MGRATGFEDGSQSINRAAEGFGGVLASFRPERLNNPFGGHGAASLSQQQLQELASLAGMPFFRGYRRVTALHYEVSQQIYPQLFRHRSYRTVFVTGGTDKHTLFVFKV
jgi:hypothetical protein